MFSDPKKIVSQLNLKRGARVADLGAGSGFYSIEIAKAVGAEGKVYAVDIIKDLLPKLKNEASKNKLQNIEVVWGDIERLGRTKLADSSVDNVVVANVLFQISDKENLTAEAKRILKKGGEVLVVDWDGSFGGTGPAPESVFPAGEAKKLFESKGFVFLKEISAGEQHYGIIFKKN